MDLFHLQEVISWTKTIAASPSLPDAFLSFHRMHNLGLKPDRVTLLTLLNLCASNRCLQRGTSLHNYILHVAWISLAEDLPLANATADMYCKNGRLQEGRSIFDQVCRHRGDVICWNAMITAYAQNGHPLEALLLFQEMQLEGVSPDPVTLSLVLASVSTTDSRLAEHVHQRIICSGLDADLILGTGLVNMYARLGDIDRAEEAFQGVLSVRGGGDVILWTSMVGVYAQAGYTKLALEQYRRMQLEGVRPNRITFINVLTACNSPAWLREGVRVHEQLEAEKAILQETSMLNAVLGMYIKCGDVKRAAVVFQRTKTEARKLDVISWNTMIAGYAGRPDHERNERAGFELFFDMLQDGRARPDRITVITMANACTTLEQGRMLHSLMSDCEIDEDDEVHTAMIHMYARCGRVDAASTSFHQAQVDDHPCAWSAMVTAMTQNGLNEQAIICFQRMQLQGLRPDAVAFTAALDSAAALSVNSSTHRKLYAQVVESGLLETHAVVATALIHVLGKIGAVDEAYVTFRNIQEQDCVSWNAMLQVFAQHGYTDRAVQHFRDMQHEGVPPNDVTFVSLLSLCSHAGLVDVGMECYLSMTMDHNIEQLTHELSGCVVDLFSRLGRLDEAHDLLRSIPSPEAKPEQQPQQEGQTLVQWMALLCAARVQGDTERTSCAAKQVLQLDPGNSAAFVALSNQSSSLATELPYGSQSRATGRLQNTSPLVEASEAPCTQYTFA